MSNSNKHKLLEKLREDQLYQTALGMAESDEERKRISSLVENMVGNFAEIFSPIIEKINADKTLLQELERELTSDVEKKEPVEENVKSTNDKNAVINNEPNESSD